MTDRIGTEQPVSELRSWIEPEISVLAIEETAGFPGVGMDGSVVGPDCTQS
jgi:hypothetical protein